MSWFSQKSNIKTERQYEEQSTKPIESIEQQVLMSIESIQKFYNLNSQKTLINMILDIKESAKFFSRKEPIVSTNFKDELYFQTEKQQKRIKFFAQKYSYQALVDKFPKPKSGTNQLLLRILEKKMEKNVITSHQTRKSIWLLASGSKFNMINNKDLYENLLKYTDYPKYFQRSIIQDLHRTVNKTTSFSIDDDISKLKNVLIAFSRRNPYIGYCQGLNFIAFFLLTMQFSEQEAFFLLSTMLESIIPMDYYTNMIGVVCDQQIFINVLKVLKPHIVQKFDELGLDPSVLSIEWFVCLFTSSLPFYLVKIVWDRLLVQGTRAFIKTGLIILSYFQDSIMQASQFHQIIMILQKGSKNLQVSQTAFNAEFQKYYIDKKGLKIARDLYRQYHIKQKLSEKVVAKRGKNIQPKCNLKWPICISKLQKLRRQREQIDVWIYRPQTAPKIIHDYLSNKPHNFQQKINITGTFISTNGSIETKNTNIFSSFASANQSIYTANQSHIESIQSEVIDKNMTPKKEYKVKNQTTKIISKDELQEILTSRNLAKRSSQLIIGRMDHICQKQAIQMEKLKKVRKSQIKYLSMIFQGHDEPIIQQKRSQTYKKIAKASQIFEEQTDNKEKTEKNVMHQNNEQKQQIRTMQRQQRALLARSRTVNFYNEFIQKNKQLSAIMCGVNNGNNQQQKSCQTVQQQQEQHLQINGQQVQIKDKIQDSQTNSQNQPMQQLINEMKQQI